jgi:hypothetical protein
LAIITTIPAVFAAGNPRCRDAPIPFLGYCRPDIKKEAAR